MPLLEVSNLCVQYRATGHAAVTAVDGVSFIIAPGESVGLVGESGCGKTTIGRAVLKLIPYQAGSIKFDGREVAGMTNPELRGYRRMAQMIFQDPLGALNPRQSIGSAISEVLRVHKVMPHAAIPARVVELLAMTGLDREFAGRYPHEMSGGQRQRIGIARALALEPRLLVADEPVSALDVSIQAQVMNLLMELKTRLGFACLFIAHDLAVVRYMCSRLLVMRQGRIVEEGGCDDVIDKPRHPYTRELLAAVPRIEC